MILGEDTGKRGTRIPSFFVYEQDKMLYVYNNNVKTSARPLVTHSLSTTKFHKIVYIQKYKEGKIFATLLVDGNEIGNQELNAAKNYDNVNLYVSDPWYDSLGAHAELKDLVIKRITPPSLSGKFALKSLK